MATRMKRRNDRRTLPESWLLDLHDYPSHLYFSKFTQIILLFKKYLLIQLQKHFVEQRMHALFSHQRKTYWKALIFHTKITFLYTTYTTNKKAVDTAFHIDGF